MKNESYDNERKNSKGKNGEMAERVSEWKIELNGMEGKKGKNENKSHRHKNENISPTDKKNTFVEYLKMFSSYFYFYFGILFHPGCSLVQGLREISVDCNRD